MDLQALNETALMMVTPGKGLLAADESSPTIQKRLDAIGVPNTEPNRQAYREMLFRAEGMSHISGVILYTETLYQDAADGTPIVELIRRAGAIPGIKIDEGAKPMAGFPDETLTEGLDGLGERLAKAYARGARFAKWRASLFFGEGRPSWGSIRSNAHLLARYAAVCQSENMVPMVEPELVMDGDHDIETCEAATRLTLRTVFEELAEQRVALEGDGILKPKTMKPRPGVSTPGVGRGGCPTNASHAEGLCARGCARDRPSSGLAVRATRTPRPGSTPCTAWGRCPGGSLSPSAAPCRTRRRASGPVSRKTSPRPSAPSPTEPG